jgi:hypothetical protein
MERAISLCGESENALEVLVTFVELFYVRRGRSLQLIE